MWGRKPHVGIQVGVEVAEVVEGVGRYIAVRGGEHQRPECQSVKGTVWVGMAVRGVGGGQALSISRASPRRLGGSWGRKCRRPSESGEGPLDTGEEFGHGSGISAAFG